jgi:hypothetical protein
MMESVQIENWVSIREEFAISRSSEDVFVEGDLSAADEIEGLHARLERDEFQRDGRNDKLKRVGPDGLSKYNEFLMFQRRNSRGKMTIPNRMSHCPRTFAVRHHSSCQSVDVCHHPTGEHSQITCGQALRPPTAGLMVNT